MRYFELISGLQINFHKSSILGIHVSDSDLGLAAGIVGCRIDSNPLKYLGLPLAVRRIPSSTWDHVIQRFKSKLALWKGSLLSVLFSLPIYFMSLLAMPKGDISSRAFYKVSLDVICRDLNNSGLGVCNLKIKTQRLLFKWLWKLRLTDKKFFVVWCCLFLLQYNNLECSCKRFGCLAEVSIKRWFYYWEWCSISPWHDDWSGEGMDALLLVQRDNGKDKLLAFNDSCIEFIGIRMSRVMRVTHMNTQIRNHLCEREVGPLQRRTVKGSVL
ncbi:uncharacterized protein LOC130014942 [Mercurialis annua]|uniref:uncharacterized protein LOC130014942 n=1 Tax=Mercurialis annua TaxID=3986 RepID=UPI0024AEE43E|nr:uncharacterized protein LOC130014942 [Mercurialis annua]